MHVLPASPCYATREDRRRSISGQVPSMCGGKVESCCSSPLASDLQLPAQSPRDIRPSAALSLCTYLLSLLFGSHLTIVDFAGPLTFQFQPLLLTRCPAFRSSFIQVLERGNLMDSTCLWPWMLSFWGTNGCISTGLGSSGP